MSAPSTTPNPPVLVDLVLALDVAIERHFNLARLSTKWSGMPANLRDPLAVAIDDCIGEASPALSSGLEARESLAREILENPSARGSFLVTVRCTLNFAALERLTGFLATLICAIGEPGPASWMPDAYVLRSAGETLNETLARCAAHPTADFLDAGNLLHGSLSRYLLRRGEVLPKSPDAPALTRMTMPVRRRGGRAAGAEPAVGAAQIDGKKRK